MEIFADRIKQLRTEKDATGEDIEKATGITSGITIDTAFYHCYGLPL